MFKGVYFFISLLMLQLQSCNSQTMNIDTIIDKYNETDFGELKDMSIYFRSTGHQPNSSIYFVNKFNGNCSPYVVEFNNIDKTIVEIKNHLVLTNCKEDYLSKEQIEAVIKKYVEYKLCLLQVDSEGNVYINPDKQELPIFLRKSPNSTPQDLGKFKHYKGDWYLRK